MLETCDFCMGLIFQLVRGTIIGGEKKQRARDCGKVVNASGHASLQHPSTVDPNLEGCCGSGDLVMNQGRYFAIWNISNGILTFLAPCEPFQCVLGSRTHF